MIILHLLLKTRSKAALEGLDMHNFIWNLYYPDMPFSSDYCIINNLFVNFEGRAARKLTQFGM